MLIATSQKKKNELDKNHIGIVLVLHQITNHGRFFLSHII
jgi:hypothetical protein